MKSEAAGGGAVYVATRRQPRFGREQMAPLPVHHDTAWHTHRVDFTLDSPLTALRIDPAAAPGTIDIAEIRLIHWTQPGAGRVVRHWEF